MIGHWPRSATRERSGLVRPFDLGQTYDRYARLLYSIAYSVLGDRGDAEDCVHDTLLRVWRNPQSYDESRGELKPLLVVAVRNAAITLLRRRTRHREIEETLPRETSTAELEIPDYLERSQLAGALRALPAQLAQVVQLGYFEHLTHVQIAARLELPLGTVKSRIALAIRQLAQAMPAKGRST